MFSTEQSSALHLRTACTTLALLGAIALCSCKREERAYRVDPPLATRINSKQLVTLEPGPRSPSPPTKNAYEENANALSDGKRLYTQMNCVGCHAHGGGGMGPPLMDSQWIYGSQPEQIFATIVEGRPNGMPSFRGHIADYQVWELAAYVRSLSGLAFSNAATGRDDHLRGGQPENSAQKTEPKQSFVPKSAEMP